MNKLRCTDVANMKIKQTFIDRLQSSSLKIELAPIGTLAVTRFNHLENLEYLTDRMQMANGNSDEGRTIEAERRRRAEPPSSGRRRADTPQRRDTSGGGGGMSDGYGGSQSSGGLGLPSLGGRGPKTIGGVVLMLVVLCIFLAIQYFGGSNNQSSDQTALDQQPADLATEPNLQSGPLIQKPTRTPKISLSGRPTAAPGQEEQNAAAPTLITQPATSSSENQTWLVMLYQDADDKVLEQDIMFDLNEAERAGSTDRVNIVAQVDRFRSAYSGDGNWTGARRYHINQDNDLSKVHSEMVADLGEVNMSSSKTLIDFVTWAMSTYPADKYALILSDHGMGWPGGWSDADNSASSDSRIPLAARLGDELYLNEIDVALGKIRAQTGLDKFELIGMDACLMGQMEVFDALAPHARYAVASQEVEPALGWAYTGFLQALDQNPDQDGAALSQKIVSDYIVLDQRIVDRNARAEFLSQASPFGRAADISAAQLANQIGQSSTLTALDLSQVSNLNESLNRLALALQNIDQSSIARARTYAQSFTSIFGNQVPPSYIDLGNFLQLLTQRIGDPELAQAAGQMQTAIQQALIAEKHGPKRPGATGITIYFPNSQLYQSPVTGAESYTAIADRFANDTLWDDFLAYHYTGEQFQESIGRAVVPSGASAVRAPGAGQIQISTVTTSSKTAAPGSPVTLSAKISGDNVGYIHLLVGYYDRQANSILIADTDYLESSDTRQVNGIYYPDWGQGDFTLKFTWEPIVFAINDGTNTVTALFQPHSYGETFEQATYSVDGIYTYSDSGEQRSARLYFSNGELTQVVSFSGGDSSGAPREITPNPGDQFTVLETWLDLDQSGNVSKTATQDGGTLTFGDQPFLWEELDAAAGDYIVGFAVSDLDGNTSQAFTNITVK